MIHKWRVLFICFKYSCQSACSAGGPGSIPGGGKIPWRREWLPSPVFLPGEFQGQRSLASYSPWGCKGSDTTEQLTFHFSAFRLCILFFFSVDRDQSCFFKKVVILIFGYVGLSCGAQTLWLWCPGLVAPWHMGS